MVQQSKQTSKRICKHNQTQTSLQIRASVIDLIEAWEDGQSKGQQALNCKHTDS